MHSSAPLECVAWVCDATSDYETSDAETGDAETGGRESSENKLSLSRGLDDIHLLKI